MSKIKFAAIQAITRDATGVRARDRNVRHACDIIRKLDPVDLVVLPELFTVGYGKEVFRNLKKTAENRDGPSFKTFQALAKERDCYICFGFPEKDVSGYYISQAVINNAGEVEGIYRKIHLAQFGTAVEKDYFRQGDQVYTGFEVKGVKIGIAICYDFRFPMTIMHMAMGNDFLLHPSVFARDDTFASWHPFIITRALENQVYVLSLNRGGSNFGNSLFCPPGIQPPTIMGHWSTEATCGIVDTDLVEEAREKYPLRSYPRSDS